MELDTFEARGKARYEASCEKQPNYHDGAKRKTWDQLGKVEQWSWSRLKYEDYYLNNSKEIDTK